MTSLKEEQKSAREPKNGLTASNEFALVQRSPLPPPGATPLCGSPLTEQTTHKVKSNIEGLWYFKWQNLSRPIYLVFEGQTPEEFVHLKHGRFDRAGDLAAFPYLDHRPFADGASEAHALNDPSTGL